MLSRSVALQLGVPLLLSCVSASQGVKRGELESLRDSSAFVVLDLARTRLLVDAQESGWRLAWSVTRISPATCKSSVCAAVGQLSAGFVANSIRDGGEQMEWAITLSLNGELTGDGRLLWAADRNVGSLCERVNKRDGPGCRAIEFPEETAEGFLSLDERVFRLRLSMRTDLGNIDVEFYGRVENTNPVAKIHVVRSAISGGNCERVTLDSTTSADSESTIHKTIWSVAKMEASRAVPVYSGTESVVRLDLCVGVYSVDLVVFDGQMRSGEAFAEIVVGK